MGRQDLLWKGAIKDFFPFFMKFFYPEQSKKIDFSKGVNFLDKELSKIYPVSLTKNRQGDLLVKVSMKTGKVQYLLIHIEVQGYVDDDFAFRMFISYYRIFDQLKLPIKAFVIYSDDDEMYHPKAYHVKDDGWGTEVIYKFKTYKLLEQKIETLEKSRNPFAIVMATAWHGLYKNCPKTDDDLLKLKVRLFRNLLAKGYSKPEITKLMEFIKRYVRFKKTDFYAKFDTEIQQITKNKHPMGIQEAIIYSAKLEGMEIGEKQGIEKGMEKGIHIGEKQGMEKGIHIGEKQGMEKGIHIGEKQGMEKAIKKILRKGHAIQTVADMFDVSVEYVRQLNQSLKKL